MFQFNYTSKHEGKIVLENETYTFGGSNVYLETEAQIRGLVERWNVQGRGYWQYSIDKITPVVWGRDVELNTYPSGPYTCYTEADTSGLH